MKRHPVFVLALTLSLVPLSVAQQSASLSSDEEEAVYLSPFEISSDRVSGYRAADSIGGARVVRPLIETPASISVVTNDFINDLSATSIVEATQYLAGITRGAMDGAGGYQNRSIVRGFELYGLTIDNMTGLGSFQMNMEPQLIERVEIVKGPNALLSSSGVPGGTVNLITKSPQFEPGHVLKLELADEQFGSKVTLDSTGRVPHTERFAYRVIASYQDAASNVPGRIVYKTLHPMLTWAISPKTQLKLKGDFMFWEARGAAALLEVVGNAGGRSGSIRLRPDLPHGATVSVADIAPGYSYDGANGRPDWALGQNHVVRGTAELTHQLSDNINVRLAGLRRYYHAYGDSGGLRVAQFDGSRNPLTGEFSGTQIWTRTDPTQPYDPVTNPYLPPTTVPAVDTSVTPSLVEAFRHDWIHEAHIQADFLGKWAFGSAGAAPLAVVNTIVGASRAKTWSHGQYWDVAPDPVPLFDFSQPFLANPPRPTGLSGPTILRSDSGIVDRTRNQAYANAQVDLFGGRLLLGGGVAYQRFNRRDLNRMTGASPQRKGEKSTPFYSLLYRVTPWASVYGSHSGNSDFTWWFTGTQEEILWREGKQDEAGVKLELFERRVSLTASYYELKQTNLVTLHPLRWIDPTIPDILADMTNEGFELELLGNLTPNLTVIASYSEMKVRDHLGRRRIGVPDQIYNGLVRYAFREGAAKGLGVFIGFNYMGSVAAESPTQYTEAGAIIPISLWIGDRTLFNAGASYDYGPLRFQLNVENLGDKKALLQGLDRRGLMPLPGRNIRLTTTYRF